MLLDNIILSFVVTVSVKIDLLKSMWIGFLMSASHLCFGRRNVIFLVADDMRHELGTYCDKDFPSPVHPPIHSPNIDKLAAKSLLLKRAYCQQALCSPSRTSLLTGRRCDTIHVYELQTYWRKSGGNFTTILEYLKTTAIFLLVWVSFFTLESLPPVATILYRGLNHIFMQQPTGNRSKIAGEPFRTIY